MSALDDFFTELTIYSESLPAKIQNIAESPRNVDWFEKRAFIKNNNWQSLLSTSESKITALDNKLSLIINEQAAINSFMHRFFEFKGEYINRVDQSAAAGLWNNVRTELSNSTEITADNIALVSEKVEEFSSSSSKLFYYLIDQLENITTALDHSIIITLSKLFNNKYSAFIAKLNLSQGGVDLCDPNNCYYYHKNIIEQKLEEIRILVANDNRMQASRKAQLLEEWLDQKITTKFLPILNNLFSIRGGDVNVEKQLMKISHLTRIAFTYSASMIWLKWRLSFNTRYRKNNNLLKKTSTLTTDLIEPNGLLKSINTLVNNPAQYNTVEVVTEGTISHLEKITVGPDTVISRGKLNDSNGNEIRFVIPFYLLDSTGLVVGSYCELMGTFYEQNSEYDNNPAITLKRYSLTKLDNVLFNGWLRQQINTIFELVPHNFCLKHSFEKGSDGAINPVKYDVVGKEIKFFNSKSIQK